MDSIPSALKAFVIGAGLLLIAGSVLLVILLVRREALPTPVVVVDAPLPAGALVEQVVPDGRRLVLLGRDGAGAQFIAVIDPLSGERLSLVRLVPDG